MQTVYSNQSSPEVVINENFSLLKHQEVYGLKASTTTGLTWGYWGGRFSGISVSDGTLSLTASSTNYIVVNRSTGAITTSTTTTNWDNIVYYARVYKVVTGTATVTSYEDHRVGSDGVHGFGSDVQKFTQIVNNQTGTSYTILVSDKSKLLSFSNVATKAVSLPQATTLGNTFWFEIQNTGAGDLVLTPSTSTIDGLPDITIGVNQGMKIVSDGTNYFTWRGAPANGTYTFNQQVNVQTGTSYTLLYTDFSKLLSFSNASTINVTLPDASGFITNFWFEIENIGPGSLNINLSTSTIDGNSVFTLSANQGVKVVSNGTNYYTLRGAPSNGTGAALGVSNIYTAAQIGAVTALTYSATITPDLSLGNNYSVTLTGSTTLANPTNIVAGQGGVIHITQDVVGGRTMAFGSYWKFSGGVAPALSSTANAVDALIYLVETPTRITTKLITDLK